MLSNNFKIKPENLLDAFDFIRKNKNKAFIIFTKDELFESKIDLSKNIERISNSRWEFEKDELVQFSFSLSLDCIVAFSYGYFDNPTVDIDLFMDKNNELYRSLLTCV